MADKPKFERAKSHVNVGIVDHVDSGKTRLTAAIAQVLAIDVKDKPKVLPAAIVNELLESGLALSTHLPIEAHRVLVAGASDGVGACGFLTGSGQRCAGRNGF